ncbi:MAG TPA: acyltransferase [Polyangiaceae bacterium]
MAHRHVGVLDGVRGLAVLLVMAHHLGWTMPDTTWLGALVHTACLRGFVGVDLFFVLSGYLITGGLIAPSPLATGARMKRFYVRRALRIFPLYYACIGMGSIVALSVGARPPNLLFWVYLHNYWQARHPDPEAWTVHLWSLAIEEQFYLVWPTVMLLLPRARIPSTALILVGGVVARLGILLYGGMSIVGASAFVYCATYTRMDGLLCGALVAIVESDKTSTAYAWWTRLRVPGLMLVLLVYLALHLAADGSDVLTRVSIGFEVFALAYGFALVLSATIDGTVAPHLTRFFDRKLLQACGKISYGMYVIHWPIMALLIPSLRRTTESLSPWAGTFLNLALLPVGAVVTYFLARASYRWFESPFLALKERFAD